MDEGKRDRSPIPMLEWLERFYLLLTGSQRMVKRKVVKEKKKVKEVEKKGGDDGEGGEGGEDDGAGFASRAQEKGDDVEFETFVASANRLDESKNFTT